MNEAFICDFVRTPIGRYEGGLSRVRPDDLAAVAIKHLAARHSAIGEVVDEVFMGCANQAGEDNRNVARMALLLAGLPARVPGMTVNRLCASGLDAVAAAARAIRAGEIELAIAGGVESMTRAPFVMGKAERAFQRTAEIYDTTIGWRFANAQMKALYGVDSMPETGENVAADFNISRADQDAFAFRSQQRAARAQDAGVFAEQIVPVTVPQTKGASAHVVERDEQLRLKLSDFDVIELNEAFASQALACVRAFGLADDAEHVNSNGGAIALGHPLGMSGARIAGAAVQELLRRSGRYGLATMCVGVGQGAALAFERA